MHSNPEYKHMAYNTFDLQDNSNIRWDSIILNITRNNELHLHTEEEGKKFGI